MIINIDRHISIRTSMICKRCGQCCFYLDIFIINPRSILPDGTLNPDDTEAMIFKPARKTCPHLVYEAEGEGKGKVAVCTIHHLPCYRGSPCEQFEQMGQAEDICMMFGYFRMQGKRACE